MADLKKNWGILGAGTIASKLAKGVSQIDDAVLYAVGSRDIAKSKEFALKYGAQKAFGSYEELCQCPDIDVIYIATPHSFHKEHAMLALKNGKNVLCEKPFSLNLKDSEEILSLAKSKGLFIMEAMWTCLLPGMKKLQELLDGGAIGQVLYMEADFGFQEAFAKNARLFNLELGGGALLDVGIYPLTLATFLFGKPKRVTANARLGQTGVDELSCYNLEFENRVMANLSSSIAVETSHSATIYGTEGTIHIPADWWLMEKLIITNGSIKEIDTSYEGSEYAFEVQEVCDCINNGQLESETLPHDWTRSMMSLMDDIRSQIGLVYPGEFIKA